LNINTDIVADVCKARVKVALYDAYFKHAKCNDKLRVHIKPHKGVSVKDDCSFKLGQLCVVPFSPIVSLAKKGDDGALPANAVMCGDAYENVIAYVTPKIVEPQRAKEAALRKSGVSVQSADASILIVPYWFIRTTSDKSLANMETCAIHVNSTSVPIMKNIAAIKGGEELMVYKQLVAAPSLKRCAAPSEATKAKPKKRPR
jgi:hypothetical protein